MDMDFDFDDAPGLALRRYVQLVTRTLGLSGECSYVQVERPASGYVALDGRLPSFPDHDVALLWNEGSGWSAAIETHSGMDLIVLEGLGGDVLPPPQVVARWVEDLFRDENRDQAHPTLIDSSLSGDDSTRRRAMPRSA